MKNTFRGVTYSQFDNIHGPKLLFCYPKDAISVDTFESLSDYAIVGKHFSDKAIVVKADDSDIQFINYSIAIDNSKYIRNTIMFSFGFVLERSVDSTPYEGLLRKVSETFRSLEVSSYRQEFIYFHILYLIL